MEGDYKQPPPAGIYEARLERSKRLRKFAEVVLTSSERQLLGRECVRPFTSRALEAVSLAVGGQHLHLQFKCHPQLVVATLGDLKRAMWYARSQSVNSGGLWGRGRKVIPIKSRPHQARVFNYILDHRKVGAWVWCFRDGFDLG